MLRNIHPDYITIIFILSVCFYFLIYFLEVKEIRPSKVSDSTLGIRTSERFILNEVTNRHKLILRLNEREELNRVRISSLRVRVMTNRPKG